MTAPQHGPEGARVRLAILGVVAVSLFAAMFARLWFLQVMDSRVLAGRVVHNATRTVLEPAPRGLIRDRNGTPLVENHYPYVVTLSRQAAKADPAVIDRLAALFGMTSAEVRNKVDDPRYSPYRPVPIKDEVPLDQIVYIKEHSEDFPPEEVIADRQAERFYPNGPLASHVLGYVGEINDTELKSLKDKGYVQGDEIGKTGVEQSYEQYLRGKPGKTVFEVDAQGNVLRTLQHEDPVQGDDVQLALDIHVQQIAEDSLVKGLEAARSATDRTNGGKNFVAPAGAVTVLDPRDGSVIAMASQPTYDPTSFINGIKPDVFAAMQDPASHFPLSNRAIGGQYAPGSTFKLVTSTAGLEKGVIAPNTTFPDNGVFKLGNRTYHNALNAVFGRVPLASALTISSDIYFYNVGALFWQQRSQFGDTGIQDVAKQYGLGVPTTIPLPGEAPGRVPTPASRKKLHDKNPKAFPEGGWFAGDNVNL
ncbi:MAG: penicillin-binding protein 2, partial [Acidimicrobiaceae bacterium]|nr:penicillin-binding protein 2 [Acidimicrobiaceae bacterium]